jgi:glucose/arabinose dehydrogenase/PKD repeat protein
VSGRVDRLKSVFKTCITSLRNTEGRPPTPDSLGERMAAVLCQPPRFRRGACLALFAVGLVLAGGVLTATAHSATYPSDFEERTVIGGLTMPTAVAYTPDGRTLITEKSGQLKIAAPGASTATTILDDGNKVNAYWDRGLLGIAVDSSFLANHFIYLLYTYELNPASPDGSGPMVSRLTRAVLNPDSTVGPETVLLGSYAGGTCPAPSNSLDCIPSEGASHSIGSVRSAPDGSLYVGSGDASSFAAVDPTALRTYDETSMAGKILHIDRDGNGLASHPFCPSETDRTKVCTKLYAKGFRNPFRFLLRPNGAGLTVGDVGWNTREEVDLVPSGGKSYGWPCYEGTIRTPGYADRSECAAEYAKEGTANAHVGPVYDWPHVSSNAVVGGPTYTSDQFPSSYRDSIFVGDYAAGFVKRLELNGSDQVTAVHDFATGWSGVDIEQTPGPSGDLVYVSFGTPGMSDGSIKRIVYTPGNRTPTARASASPTSGSAPLDVDFDASASSDPDGDVLTYAWDFGDGTTGSGATPTHTYANVGSYTARVTVDDGRGRTDSATVPIDVGGSNPVVSIDAPADGSTYRDGQVVTVRGSASDAQDGTLPASAFSWDITLKHIDHNHPVSQPQGVSETAFTTAVDHDYDSYYEITLTVIDSDGHTASTKTTIRPEGVSFGITSSPAGAPVSYGGRSVTTPFTTTAAIGFKTTVTAAAGFNKNGRRYVFSSWSDGGARVHDVTVPATASTLTATYTDAGPSGPVVALPLDEGIGSTVRDVSGNVNDGTISGAAWTPAGKYGPGLTFDGVDDWVTVADADSLDIGGPLTLEAWVKPRVQGIWDNVLVKEAPASLAYALYATGDAGAPRPNAAVGVSELFAPGVLPTGAWTHLAATYDGSAIRIYVDGVLVATQGGVTAPPTTGNPLRIGGDTIGSDEFFDGSIDEIRIYDRALTADEVGTDMNTRIGAPPLDTTPPTVAITAPPASATISGTTDVRADATDETGVESVQFTLDGSNLGAADTAAPYAVSWDTTTAVDGEHVLAAVARDAAGNTTTSAQRLVVVSNASAASVPVVQPGFGGGSVGGVAGGSGPTAGIVTPADAVSRPSSKATVSGAGWRNARKLRVRVKCKGTQKCRGSITVRTAKPVKRGRRRAKLKLANARLAVPAGKTAAVTLRLSRKTRKALGAKSRVKVVVTVKLLRTGGKPVQKAFKLTPTGRR